ncbi:MAG: hypothetical protein JJU30_06745 [Alkalimonas sp.]|nr:hypothetical protein [Alkalimonas sp.]
MRRHWQLPLALGLMLALSHCSQLPPPAEQRPVPNSINGLLLPQLNRNLAMTVTLDSTELSLAPWDLDFQPVDPMDPALPAYLQVLRQELRKYPPELLALSGVQHILLVRDLSVAGQPRLAVPDYVHDVLIYDIAHFDLAFNRHVMHHEFYHQLEARLYGTPFYRDPLWLPLKPDGFRYGNGGANARASSDAAFSHPMQGFVNRYAMSGLEEDKAELWAILWADTSWQQVKPLLLQDKLLRDKLQLLVYQISCQAPAVLPRLQHRLSVLGIDAMACSQKE